jgi:hypothetical protein
MGTEFLCEDNSECGFICPDHAISIPTQQALAEIPFRLSKPFLINLRLAAGDVKTRLSGF